ncbi:MAG: hypothetical protein JNL97_13720, partial [Verrucomicrobiales bacterium]|nr:hypothetical protein [Verrucomicrobiales bacterium]
GFSAHAGRTDLLGWMESIAGSRPRVVLTHGEETGRSGLAEGIRERFGIRCDLPGLGDVVEV